MCTHTANSSQCFGRVGTNPQSKSLSAAYKEVCMMVCGVGMWYKNDFVVHEHRVVGGKRNPTVPRKNGAPRWMNKITKCPSFQRPCPISDLRKEASRDGKFQRQNRLQLERGHHQTMQKQVTESTQKGVQPPIPYAHRLHFTSQCASHPTHEQASKHVTENPGM